MSHRNIKPNVLLVITEQQSARAVAPESPCLTPHLDQLAQRGMRFTCYHAPNAICSPSRASLFTGVYPSRHGMVDCTHTVEPYRAKFNTDFRTWSQILRDNGYTGGLYGKWHVERTNKLEDFGFSEYILPGSKEYREYRRKLGLTDERNFTMKYTLKHRGYRDALLYGVVDEPLQAFEAYFLFEQAAEFIRRSSGNPWFVVISPMETHDPFVTPKEFYDLYEPEKLPLPKSFNDGLERKPTIQRRLREVWKDITAEKCKEAMACFFGMSSFVDHLLGRVIATLEATGQLDNTIVIYTSDHGELLGAHGLFLKGVPAYEEVYNIPFIVAGPGVVQGQLCSALANHADLAPTILELTGADCLSGIDGRSFADLLRGQGDPATWSESWAEFHGQRFFYTQRIVWSGKYKYVFNGFDYDELYDLEQDPYELNNLAGDPEYAEVLEDMARRMWRRIRQLGDHNMYNAQYPMFRFAPVGPMETE